MSEESSEEQEKVIRRQRSQFEKLRKLLSEESTRNAN